jgi:putative phosphoesterase
MIAVLADTHMPRGARRLPTRCVELIGQAEAVIHAGDFFGASALAEIRALCPLLHAVRGNVDEPALRDALPETLEVTLGGITVAQRGFKAAAVNGSKFATASTTTL